MRATLIALVPLLLASLPALAADFDGIAPIIGGDEELTPIIGNEGLRGSIGLRPSWQGFYVGVTAGGAIAGRFTGSNPGLDVAGVGSATAPALRGSVDSSGALIGGTAGLQYEADSVVVGLEADVSGSTIDGGVSYSIPDPFGVDPASVGTLQAKARLRYLATIRGRIGYAFDRLLIYATGGVALGSIKASLAANYTNAAGSIGGKLDDTKLQTGYVVGAGAEFRLSDAWSVKAEYLFADLGKRTYRFNLGNGVAARADLEFQTQLVRGGLNYRF